MAADELKFLQSDTDAGLPQQQGACWGPVRTAVAALFGFGAVVLGVSLFALRPKPVGQAFRGADVIGLNGGQSSGASEHLGEDDVVKMRGWDCWEECKGPGHCEMCGEGNACCRRGSTTDPPECSGITDFWTDHHECVTPREEVEISRLTQDCWMANCQIGGDCAWCGKGNSCCKKGFAEDPAECQNITVWPTDEHHTCVKSVVDVKVKHAGQNCYEFCKGSGHCDWCGKGNLCCKYGQLDDKPECRPVIFFPTTAHHTCVAAALPPTRSFPKEDLEAEHRECPLGQVAGAQGCQKPASRVPLTFYMYRALGDTNTPIENSNAASLGGILWYLHKEVVTSCPRKHHITRIQRLRVTVQNTNDLFAPAPHALMGPFADFANGACTSPNCDYGFEKFGNVVGCRLLDVAEANYQVGSGPQFWSLPGPCPTMADGAKSEQCLREQKGGRCLIANGQRDCTYSIKEMGTIRIDDLIGRDPGNHYEHWCADGNLEYDPATDTGHGTSFWQGIHDQEKCKERMDKLRYYFRLWTVEKSDSFEREADYLGEPACDWYR